MDPLETPVRFENDDEGYLAWIRRYPRGHVLNADNPPTVSYLILHRASCHTISDVPTRGESWTKAYIKVCAIRPAQLKEWALTEVEGEPTPCGFCTPRM
jgi:hypothetical protein